jgi:hypothetical protein
MKCMQTLGYLNLVVLVDYVMWRRHEIETEKAVLGNRLIKNKIIEVS